MNIAKLKMFSPIIFLLFVMCIKHCVGPPVTKNKKPEPSAESAPTSKDEIDQVMEYHRYLKEVVSALESDPEFTKKLEQADEADIRSGKIAEQLEFVSHHVRTRLDEIKRTEMERLRQLVKKKEELINGNNIEDPNHGHLDHSNPHTFEIEDLKKLIAKTTEDLAEADRKRREEFKRYEMEKEIKKMEKLNSTNGEEREKLEKEFKEQEEKHKKHEPLHEPGHKAQLEEVWEKQDHMEQEFDPKAFFMMHDLDSNGLWDEAEVKALFVKELDKMYAAGAPEDDMRERVEEMERMRETVFRDVDKNHDGFIDYNEFIAQTKNPEFQEDHGWQSLDENRPYTDEELQEYLRQYQMQHHPSYAGYNQGGYYPNQVPPQGYQYPQGYQVPPQGYPNQPHPPPQAYNQVPPQGYPNQSPPQAYHQGPPQGYPNQAPPQGYPNQAPPQGYPNQAPPQGSPNQAPPPGGYHNQAPPPGSYPNQALPEANAKQAPQIHLNQAPPQAPQAPAAQPPQVPQSPQPPQASVQNPQSAQVPSQQIHSQPPANQPQVQPIKDGNSNNLETNNIQANPQQPNVQSNLV